MPSPNRQQNYQRLKRAGFRSVEANRFKDYSEEYIEKLIKVQKKFRTEMQKILKEKGMKYHGETYEF